MPLSVLQDTHTFSLTCTDAKEAVETLKHLFGILKMNYFLCVMFNNMLGGVVS